MSNACPSGVGVKGEAVGEEGRAEVCRAEFPSDAENQGSLAPDAVAATETGGSLWVTRRTWECEEDDEGEMALWESSGWSKDRPSEAATDRERRRSSIPTPEGEGKPTLE